MIKFDSIAEQEASIRFGELGCQPCSTMFVTAFTDAEGETFRAMPDFYYDKADLYIEFKSGTLNGVKSKSSSEKQLAAKAAFLGEAGVTPHHRHTLGWNHAWRKQAIVQSRLTPMNFVVVFDELPSHKDALTYDKKGIIFCDMASLPNYLLSIYFAKKGLMVHYNLYYPKQESLSASR
ncbi:hypothetical protein GN109_23290 [Collimonas pratensis]|uniref:hypothetical protein n=1 Tax=Collimonas pratensis TaxID=279113 RepID=UPI00143DAA68|nr:hypothetical protein [Collimonas pratensis]NKI72355.1 hypothetical protein [Collimonas pratensis]